MRCPQCGKLETGQVGHSEYYCWNCCVEFHGSPGHWRLFAVDEDGALIDLAALRPGPEAADPGVLQAATPMPDVAATGMAG